MQPVLEAPKIEQASELTSAYIYIYIYAQVCIILVLSAAGFANLLSH